MILCVAVALVILAAVILYPVLKVRFSATCPVPRSGRPCSVDADRLTQHVRRLSVEIGSRSVYEYPKIEEAKKYILFSLEGMGYRPGLQDYEYRGRIYSNIIVSLQGRKKPGETVIIGAHYDTVRGTPGADDNASAVALLLEICRGIKDDEPSRTLKLIFFVLEEPPAYHTKVMGSYIYAKAAKARGEDIRAMISLEMLGYFGDREGAQAYPFPLMNLIYPSTPDFVALVGDLKSRDLVSRIKRSLEKSSDMPVETLATSRFVPGVSLSDHHSFWKMGYPAVMITDTAFYRNPHYHSVGDTIETLDFQRMSSLLGGLVQVARDLAESP
jgi:hypothetical protein